MMNSNEESLTAPIGETGIGPAVPAVNDPLIAVMAGATGSGSLSQSTAAIARASSIVQKEIQIFQSLNLKGLPFAGEAEMKAAVTNMGRTLADWSPVYSAIRSSADDIIAYSNLIQKLGNVAINGGLLNTISSPLTGLKTRTATALKDLQSFNAALENSYRQGANANQTAAAAIAKQQEMLHQHVADLKAKEAAATSAGNIILDILSLGAYAIAQAVAINKEIAALQSESNVDALTQKAYQVALGGFSTTFEASRIVEQALVSLNSAVQQLVNDLQGMIHQTSTNPIVEKALFDTYLKEFKQAAAQAQSMVN